METGKEITAREIIQFYVKKEKNQDKTNEFLNGGYGQVRGGYISFANERGEDSKQVIQILQEKEAELKKTKELCWLKALYDSKEVFLSEEEKSKPNQKWHLLISYYAYKLIVQRYGIKKVRVVEDIDAKKTTVFGCIRCPELCLWMVEAAVDGKILTHKDVKDLYANIVEIKKQNRWYWNWLSWWKKNRESYDTRLVEIILKEKERGEK